MPTISIETSPVLFPYNHLYLVYKDDNGNEVVINAGPNSELVEIPDIGVQAGVPIELSSARKDAFGNPLTPEENNSTVIDIGSRDAADVWAIMIQHAQNIHDEALQYDPTGQLGGNSNTVISSVLNAVGIDIADSYPDGTFAFQYPGTESGFFNFDNLLQGTNSADIIQGANGIDELYGNDGDDELYGNGGNDKLFGGSGGDILDGGAGADTILAGAGADTIVGSAGEDSINGGEGKDTIIFDKPTFRGLYVDLDAGEVEVNYEVDSLIFQAQQTISNVEIVLGSQFADTITGDAGDNEFNGGEGSDTLIGGGGTDTFAFTGDFGHDTVLGGEKIVIDDIEIDGSEENLTFNEYNGGLLISKGLDNSVFIGDWVEDGAYGITLETGEMRRFEYTTKFDATAIGLSSNEDVTYGFEFDPNQAGEVFGNATRYDITGYVSIGGDTIGSATGHISFAEPSGSVDYSSVNFNLSSYGNAYSGNTIAGQFYEFNINANLTSGNGNEDPIFYAGHLQANSLVIARDVVYQALNFTFGKIEENSLGTPTDDDFVLISEQTGSRSDPDDEVASISSVEVSKEYIGTQSADTLNGSLGGDLLYGNAGNDTLNGDAGDDRLYGGAGDDVLNGGTGTDTFSFLGDFGNDVVSGGEFVIIDNILVNGLQDSLAFEETNGGLLITKDATNSVFLSDWTSGKYGIGIGNVITADDNDSTLSGTYANDQIIGGEGNDQFYSSAGSDTFDGGNGIDTISYDTGNGYEVLTGITVDLSAGTTRFANNNEIKDTFNNIENVLVVSGLSTLIGDDESNSLTALGGNSRLEGKGGNDILRVSFTEGNNTVLGGSGDDSIFSSNITGDDLYDGGDGRDIIHLNNNFGNNTIIRGEFLVIDSVAIDGTQTEYAYEKLSGGGLLITSNTQDASVLLSDWTQNGDYEISVFPADNQIIGDGDDNTLEGTAGDDLLEGLGGNDNLIASNGNDIINGGEGVDFVRYLDDRVTITSGLEIDLQNGTTKFLGNVGIEDIHSGIENVLVSSQFGDTIIGNESDNLIFAGEGDNYVSGNGGNDILVGGTQNDNLVGGEGDDILDGRGGHDILDGGAGIDTVLLFDGFTFADVNNAEIVQFNGTTLDGSQQEFSYRVVDSGGLQLSQTTGGGIQLWDWSQDGDYGISLDGNNSRLFGDAGDNYLFGTTGDDEIYGLEGSDYLIDGGGGDDLFDGGAGYDYLALSGNFGNDIVTGVELINIDGVWINGSESEFTFEQVNSGLLVSSGPNDSVFLSDWSQNGDYGITVAATGGQIFGDAGDNVIYGTAGDDEIFALAGFDFINASDGNDFIDGGDSFDTLNYSTNDYNITDALEVNLQTGTATYLTSGAIKDTFVNIESGIVVSGFNDVLIGDDQNNTLFAFGGNNRLEGHGGDDRFNSGEGNDILLGGAGNDTFEGSGGDDYYDGGEGFDLFYIYGDFGNDTITGGEFINLDGVWLNGSQAQLTFEEIAGSGLLISNSQDDSVLVTDWTTQNNYGITLSAAPLIVDGTEGDDVLFGDTGADTLNGLGGNDILYGLAGDDALFGGAGDDILEGGAGSDSYNGGAGNDQFIVGSQDYIFDGGEGFDTIFAHGFGAYFSYYDAVNIERIVGGEGDDYFDFYDSSEAIELFGEAGIDVFYGGYGNDTFFGGADNDEIYANDGDDTIDGGEGDDLLDGGEGIDRFSFSGVFGNDQGYGGEIIEIDGTVIDGSETGFTFDIQEFGLLITQSADSSIFLNDWFQDGDYGISFAPAADPIQGSAGDDTVNGTIGNDTLLGLAGADILKGGDGNDVLDGGEGDDTLKGEAGADQFIGGLGDDKFVIDAEDTAFDGGEGFDTILAESTNGLGVTLLGTTITSVEKIYGSIADDVFDFTASNENLDLNGREGNDVIFSGVGDDRLNGGDGDDQLYGNLGADNLSGADGNDFLSGADGDDHLNGGNGDDFLDAGIGDDAIYAGDGNDTLNGGDGEDYMVGNAGIDAFYGGVGDDRMVVEAQDSVIDGGDGFDTVVLDSAETDLNDANLTNVEEVVGNGNDNRLDMANTATDIELRGNNGDDVLIGGGGDDKISGNSGNDTLVGNAGDDVFFGNGGDDRFYAGTGDNTMKGHSGADSFYFDSAESSTNLIQDFDEGVDSILIKANGLTLADATVQASAQNGAWTQINLGDTEITLRGINVADFDAAASLTFTEDPFAF